MNNRFSHIAVVSILAVLTFANAHAAAPAPKAAVPDAHSPAGGDVAKDAAKTAAAGVSVLERFRAFSGPRTPAAMSALFSQPFPATVRQLPEVALSNGATIIAIEAVVGTPGGRAPNFAFNGARLISNDRGSQGEWQLKALPDAGILKAELIVLTDSSALEIPLVVAPPLPAETDLSEKGFVAFLGGKTPGKQPMLDLNDDGRRDYVDDYIFTANYLVRQRATVSSPVFRSSSDQGEPQAVPDPDSLQPAAVSPTDPQQRVVEQGSVPQTPETGLSFSSTMGSGSSQAAQTNTPAAAPGSTGGSTATTGNTATTSGTADTTGSGTGTTTGTGTSGILDHTTVKQRTYAEQQKIRNEQAKKNNQLIKVPNPVEVIY